MKKKALRSNRNRHTGRINAYKKRILDNAKTLFVLDDRGVEYGVLTHKKLSPDNKLITASKIVKAGI